MRALPIFLTSSALLCAAAGAQELEASDAQAFDWFGYDLALDGAWAAVGAPREDAGGQDAGAAYVFEFTGGAWAEKWKLVASDATPGARFGWAVAVDHCEARIAVGAPGEDAPGSGLGAVYLFEGGVSWTQTQKVVPPPGAADNDRFGSALALRDDVLLVGAFRADVPGAGNDAGVVYAYERGSQGFQHTATIQAPDAHAEDFFGFALAFDGQHAVIGAYNDDDGATNAGSAWMMGYAGGSWVPDWKLVSATPITGAFLGRSVAFDGVRVLLGAPEARRASLFEFTGPDWTEVAVLEAPGGQFDEVFGFEVALDGQRALVSAPAASPVASKSGTCYAFSGAPWTEAARFEGAGIRAFDYFGQSLALDGERVLVGSFLHDTQVPDAGAVWSFDASAVFPTPNIAAFCFCDTPPCGGPIIDASGCVNSVGVGAQLFGIGSPSVAADDLILRATSMPPGQPTLTFMGAQTASTPLFNGLRCVGAGPLGMHRFPLVAAVGGVAEIGPGLVAYSAGAFASNGHILAGQTWAFQTWYRDPGGPACGASVNLTHGVSVLFTP